MSELLLPVGNKDMALAAIHNGADAIYLGFPGFNARGRSADFELEELREMIELCHLYGVRAHLALNVLIFPEEFADLAPRLERVLQLKPDALIVQDLGLAALIRKMAPEQVLHGSTQMTVTNHEAMALLEDLNIQRFVLGRENSLADIKLIREGSLKDLEVFVHGALCVAYSGQCFTSESIGGRSANRGQCAQSCRFGYELFVDGEPKRLMDKKYLVSPQDLCGIAQVPALMDLGVASFKVEGRLKSPEYVAAAAREYRMAMDRHLSQKDLDQNEIDAAKRRMATTYSRGFFTGWLNGVDHQRLVDGVSKAHRGHKIGQVESVQGHAITITLDQPTELAPGDGLLWTTPKGDWGAQIYKITSLSPTHIKAEFGYDVAIAKEAAGAAVYLNSDSAQKRDLRRGLNDRNVWKRVPVQLCVDLEIGQKLKASMTDGIWTVSAEGHSAVQPAKNHAVSDQFLAEELGALGGGVFKLAHFEVRRASADPVFYPHKELKEIRRQLTASLENLRRCHRVRRDETAVHSAQETLAWGREYARAKPSGTRTRLNVMLREKAQVADLILAVEASEIRPQDLDCVLLDFEFGQDYEASVKSLKHAGFRVGMVTTRILKPKEYMHFTRIERLSPDVILIRNLGALHYFTKVKTFAGELRGDFSLNVTNPLSARYLLDKGLTRVTASYDLNSRQVSALLKGSNAACFEVTAHQYMPAFHMEHCVFAATLSQGSSFRDCGKPCEKHRVELKDEFGNRHHIKADPECRNTMFNAVAQSAARFVPEWQNLGLGSIRYEALYERGEELIDKIVGYLQLLSGEKTPTQVVVNLQLLETYGLGEGAIGKTREYQSHKRV